MACFVGSVFGQSTVPGFSFCQASTNVQSSANKSVFGQPSTSSFGQSSTSGSIFGQPSGTSSSAFGSNSDMSSSGMMSGFGLGGAPINADKNVFGGNLSFGQQQQSTGIINF